ncbi:MAG: hypothetical protein SFT92_02925 [Rickettsiales bacterium]|nr:hypothetical protein [Rickettsiales bacterium]
MMQRAAASPNRSAYIGLAAFSCFWMAALSGRFNLFVDIFYHAHWAKSFSEQFWSGEWYPRWLMALYDGMGDPVFFYYPPLAYWFTSLFHPLVALDSTYFLTLNTAALVAFFLSGVSCYHWLLRHVSLKSAFIGALMYLWFPSRIWFEYNFIYLYSQHLSYILLPLIMMGIEDLLAGRKGGILRYGICQGLLIMTNVPITIVFSGIPLLYAALSTPWRRYPKLILPIATALLIALGLSAMFWLPQQAYLSYINSSDIWNNPEQYPVHYAYSFISTGPYEASQGILPKYSLAAFAILFTIYLIFTALLWKKRTPFIRCWWWVGLACFLMMLPLSKPIWDHVSVLQVAQRPWRFFVPVCLCLSLLIALWMEKKTPQSKSLLAVIGHALGKRVSLCFAVALTAFIYTQAAHPFFNTRDAELVLYFDTRTPPSPQYMAKTIPYTELYAGYYELDNKRLARFYRSTPAVIAKGCALSPNTLSQPQSRLITFEVQPHAKSCSLELRQFYFPGWQAYAPKGALETKANSKGLISISIPASKTPTPVRLLLQAQPAERYGAMLSLTTIALLVLCYLYARRKAAV